MIDINNVELERRKEICRHCSDFRVKHGGAVYFCGRECHRPGDNAYCEPWAQAQYGRRLLGAEAPCAYWENPAMRDDVILLPFLGEFGWMLAQHVRWANWHPALSKLVCCQPGHECLFPSATGFFTDWTNPVPENHRWNDTDYYDHGARDRFWAELEGRLRPAYPHRDIVRPSYNCQWHVSDAPGYKFRPTAAQVLPPVDIVLGARNRSFDDTRNWPHWAELTRRLKARGFKLGLVGRKETCVDVPVDAYAWDHPDGDTAGSIDLLSHAGLYVGVDSGMTHLAALVDTPSLVLRSPFHHHPMHGICARANKGWFSTINPENWGDVDAVETHVLRAVHSAKAILTWEAVFTIYIDAGRDGWRERLETAIKLAESTSRKADWHSAIRVAVCGLDTAGLEWLHPFRDRVQQVECWRGGVTPEKALQSLARATDSSRCVQLGDAA